MTAEESPWLSIPGGKTAIELFGNPPEFGDCEIVRLVLDRRGPSYLDVLMVYAAQPDTIMRFELVDWIDAEVLGFSQQNVIGSLRLRQADEREITPWEWGVGVRPGEFLLELEQIFGAYGVIRATVSRIDVRIEPGVTPVTPPTDR